RRSRCAFPTRAAPRLAESIARAPRLRSGKRGHESRAAVHRSLRRRRRSREHRARTAAHYRHAAMTSSDILDRARELNARSAPYPLVPVVRAVAPTSAYLGAQAIVLPDGTMHGWIGGGCARGIVIDAARNAIEAGTPKLVRISNDRLVDDDIEQHAMSCASSG